MSTDAFVRSPKGKYFVIDTKSNLGRVFFDGSVLMRRYGKHVFIQASGLQQLYRNLSISWNDKNQVVLLQTKVS